MVAEDESDSSYVVHTVNDRVILRTDPIVIAPRLLLLDSGLELRVLKRGVKKVRIGSFRDFWYLVRTSDGVEGWVFGVNLDLGEMVETRSFQKLETSEVTGKWWQVGVTGRTGYRKIYFWPDGTYRYGYGNQLTLKGRYVLVEGQQIRLEPKSPIGDLLTAYFVGPEMRLRGVVGGREYSFRHGNKNPDVPEVGLEGGEDGER